MVRDQKSPRAIALGVALDISQRKSFLESAAENALILVLKLLSKSHPRQAEPSFLRVGQTRGLAVSTSFLSSVSVSSIEKNAVPDGAVCNASRHPFHQLDHILISGRIPS